MHAELSAVTEFIFRGCAIVFIAAGLVSAGAARTLYVSPAGTNNAAGNYPDWAGAASNIQDAVNKAVSASNDVILVTNAIYALTNQISNYGVANNVTLRSYNNGSTDPANTILQPAADYTNNSRGIFIRDVTNTVIDGFTIRNFTNTSGSASGPGIHVYSVGAGPVTITNCIVRNNKAADTWGFGGAIYGGGVIKVWNCQILANAAYNRGGGIYIDQPGSIVANCTIVSNDSFYGGGIQCNIGAVVISNCAITMNLAHYTLSGGQFSGGGLSGGGIIKNCLIANNSCTNFPGGGTAGGGLYLTVAGTVVENCIIVSNLSTFARGGGVAIELATASAILRNCLVASNNPQGIFFLSTATNTPMILDACTIARNATVGIGEAAILTNLYITNCIIAGNITSPELSNVDTNRVFYSCSPNPILPPGAGNITNAPRYVNATNNFRLAADSPCMNQGVNESWMTTGVDLDGKRRIDNFGRRVDMGAYEYLSRGFMVTTR